MCTSRLINLHTISYNHIIIVPNSKFSLLIYGKQTNWRGENIFADAEKYPSSSSPGISLYLQFHSTVYIS